MVTNYTLIRGLILILFFPLFLSFGYLGASILEKHGAENKIARYIGYTLTYGFIPLYIGSFLLIYKYYLGFILMLIIILILSLYAYNTKDDFKKK